MTKKLFLTGVSILLLVAFAMGAEAFPTENVTKGEVLVAAVRAHAGATGNNAPQSFDYAKNGYADFETYAVKNGIVLSGELGNLSEKATKLETAAILARALPDSHYKEINAVYNIPDISSSEDYYADALKMYRAGIITGDSDKNFYPDDDVNRVEVVASGIPEGLAMQMFFTTTTSASLCEANSVLSAPSKGTEEQTFILNLAEHPGFSGKFNTLRLDPIQKNDVTFTIKSISFIKNETVDLYVNGRKIDFAIKPEYNAVHDTWLIPFEPGKGYINFMLYVYHEWDYDTKTLKLYRDDKCVEFVSGSDVAKIDGKDYKLSAPVYQVDNIPMLPVENLADIFGFGCEFKDDTYYYTTPEKYIFDAYVQEEGQWNFDVYGFLNDWQCDNVIAGYGDGTVIIYSNDTDPRFRTATDGNISIDTLKYSKIEVRCRWENYNGSGMMGFFFTTDSDTIETQSKYTGLLIGPKTDEFVTLTFDMSANSNWKGKLKSLRYDIFDAKGWCEVDYIKLIK